MATRVHTHPVEPGSVDLEASLFDTRDLVGVLTLVVAGLGKTHLTRDEELSVLETLARHAYSTASDAVAAWEFDFKEGKHRA